MDTDIAIAGGGIAGLSLALLLAGEGKRVVLVEPRPPQPLADTRPTGRSLALTARSVGLLKKTGAWGACVGFAAPIAGFCLIDATGAEPVRACFTGQIPDYGANIPNAPLRAALWEAAEAQPGITLHAAAVTAYTAEPGAVRVALEDGAVLTARLLIAADGRESPLRALAGLRAFRRAVGQSALTCRITHAQPHRGIATEIWRTGGLLALVPLPGAASAVVWMDAPGALPSGGGVLPALQAASLGALGDIALETAPEVWPLERLIAPRMAAPRLALIAEAAHAVPPTGAQGLNLSLRDASLLARLAGRADDPGAPSVLWAYAARRAVDVGATVASVAAMNRAVRTGAAGPVRRGLLRVLAACPWAQRPLVRAGLAWQGAWA